MKASSLSFRAAVLFVIAGMIWGIIMGISENHATMPAHAHLNLLGWVSLFLIGTYYRLNPAVERPHPPSCKCGPGSPALLSSQSAWGLSSRGILREIR
jgi:hypothetical protein